MIKIKTPQEIKKMKKAGRLTAMLLDYITPYVKEGISTQELNDICEEWTKEHDAISAPLNYHGFPKSICTSINDVVCHGIPSKEDILKNGDIVNIDVTLILDGYHADASRTFAIGEVDAETKLLIKRAKEALDRGIKAVKPGKFLYEVGKIIEGYIKKFGYSIVRDYGGHGIGQEFHEDPFVYHYQTSENKIQLKPGMTFTIEPMVNLGDSEITLSKEDNWTVRTKDSSLSAQFEHTILVTDSGVEILTK